MSSLSTTTPEKLPGIAELQRLTQSLAVLDAILSMDWEYRYYSYNSKWGEGEEMASMRDGSGNHWFLLFSPAGAALKGYAQESVLAKDGTFASRIQEMVPQEFASFLGEPAFNLDEATFCFWRSHADTAWNVVTNKTDAADGSAEMIGILDGRPETYHAWAEEYYEHPVSLAAVQAIYRHEPLTEELVASLTGERGFSELEEDLTEIGYPRLES